MKPLTKYILLSVSVIAIMLPKRTARACASGVWPGEYRFWLLQPDLINKPDLTPFYFASTYLYRQDINAAKESYPQQNIREWYDEIKGSAAKKDIDTLLNGTDPQYFFDKQPQLAKTNSFIGFLMKPQNRDLFRYLVLSKKVEQIAARPDPWEEDNFPENSITRVIREAEALYAETHSQFIKLRTAFQLMRLYARNAVPEYANRIYDRSIEPVKTKSWVKTAALYEKAINTPGGYERNYLLSKVFHKGYRRTYCLVKFNTEWLDSTLLFARNNHERNVLKAMKVFNFSGRSLYIIKGIYRSEPAYNELPFLMLREINKVEDWLVTNRVTGFGMPAVYGRGYLDNYRYLNIAGNYKKDKAYAKELYNFLLQMISDQKSSQPALLHLCAAHLCLINEDYTGSARHLQQAKAIKGLPRNVQTQIAINTYLLHLENGFDKATENEFMNIIKTGDKQLGIYDPDIMKNQLVLYTARKMIQKGDRARGLMLLSRTNRALDELPGGGYKKLYQEIDDIAEEKDYDQILQVLHKTKKNSFEQFVTIINFRSPWENHYGEYEKQFSLQIRWDDNKLRDCKASWYIRHHRLKDALATLQQIPDSFYAQYPYDTYLGGDAFFLNLNNPHTAAKEDKRSLNKKQLIAEMVKLQQLATKDKLKTAACYYQLANAWYNMTFHGKNWMMVRQWWSCVEPDYDYLIENNKQFYDDYYGCMQAKQLYLKAMEATKDKKLAAFCFYMAQQCERNNREYKSAFKNHRLKTGYSKKHEWPDYSGARQKGIDMLYYKSLVKECELYDSYIQQYDKRPWAAN